MNEELTGRLEVSLQENEELRSNNLLLKKNHKKKVVLLSQLEMIMLRLRE
jgi:hypothetical protein